MCRRETAGATARAVLVMAATACLAGGQTVSPALRPDWRQIGDTSVELLLASPATGPVDAVWFSPDGSRLYARTAADRVYETADFQFWRASAGARPAQVPYEGRVARLPESAVRLAPDSSSPGRLYALGSHLYRSDDEGRTWTDLTGYRSGSVIGDGVLDLAVSPGDPDELVVANRFGVWRSLDGGLSWSGLNRTLPNLPVRRILAPPSGPAGVRIWLDGFGPVEASPGGGRSWAPVADSSFRQEEELRRTYGQAIGVAITALAGNGDLRYAGAADGRLFLSSDGGRSWSLTPAPAGGPIEALWVDPQEPRVALAAVGGGGPQVLRTVNGGLFWDDLTANLPEAAAHAVTADRSTGAIYVATSRGVFFTRGDLVNPGPPTSWTALSENLPQAPARDVKLGSGGSQLYVALEGYGVFAAPAPDRPGAFRWVNAADFSLRAAAPGSLLSILGGRVERARAGELTFPVLAVSDTESQVQVPYEAAGPSVALAVEGAGGRATLALPIQDVSPAIFVDRDGVPLLLDGDSGMMLNAGNSARSNSRIQILATGLGKVRPNWPAGLPAPLEGPPQVVAPVRAYLDRAPLEVTRAVLAPGYVGFYLVEVQLPAVVNSGPAELYLVSGNRESNRVRVYIQP